jgi:hypothetical protein
MRGFEQGLGDARDTLKGLSQLDDALATDIGKTESLVREGLAKFFEEQRERLAAGTAESANGPTAPQ